MRFQVSIASVPILLAVLTPPVARADSPTGDVSAQAAIQAGTSGASAATPEQRPAIPVRNIHVRAKPTPTGPQGLSANPAENTTGALERANPPVPTSPAPHVGLFPDFGRSLLDQGIDVHGIAGDHFLANPSAGVATGHTANLFAFRPAVDLDLDKLVGLPGGNLHVGLTFFGARGDIPQIITQTGGVLTGFQTTPATETAVVSVFTYEQRLLHDRLSFEFGRTNAYNYFLLPNSLDPFSYFSTSLEVNGDFPSNPYPVWGGRATYKFRPTWYVQGGAFEDNFVAATQYGDRLGTGVSRGAQLLAEVGHRSEFFNARYPSNFEAGFEWNTRTGRLNLKGTGAPALPLFQRANYSGGGVIFIQGQQVVWRGARGRLGPPANIAIYGSFDPSVDKPQPIDLDALVGVNFTGFIPGRPFDALGLQTRYQRLSQVEADGETFKQRLLARLRGSQSRDGFSFEAVGNVQVIPGFAIRPIVEYFVNPDDYYPPAPPGRPHDGFEAGFFAVVQLGPFLGTSLKPF